MKLYAYLLLNDEFGEQKAKRKKFVVVAQFVLTLNYQINRSFSCKKRTLEVVVCEHCCYRK